MPSMEPDIRLPPHYWELLGLLADGLNNADIADAMHVKLATVEKYINTVYGLLHLSPDVVNLRVSAAKWYWARRNMIQHHYIFEVSELPVIIEIRREPAGNFGGRMVK